MDKQDKGKVVSNQPESRINQFTDLAGMQKHFSPLRFLIITIGGIFLAEVIAMIVVYRYQSLPYYLLTLIDASIMIVMIFPLVYFLSLKPLIHHIDKHQRTEAALRKSESRLRRVNRALSVLNECNQVLVRAEDETKFLQRMCEILVSIGEYRMAWVGYAEHDQARSVRLAAQFGFEDGYLDSAQITWSDDERGRGPSGTAIREGVTQVNQNFLTNPKMAPWRESALLRGYQSSIALPLQNENSTFGVLTIYSVLPDAFDEDEVHLLQELANDMTFGITALHARAERRRAEAAIHQLSSIVEQTEDTVVVTNCEGFIEYVNPAFERLTGYSKVEVLGKTPRVIKSGIHDNEFYRDLWNTILRGDVFQSEIANRKKNGELFYEIKTIAPLRDKLGNITHFVATGKDVTEHKLDEERLLKAYDELELRVQDRTEELRIAISELEDEINERNRVEAEIQRYAQELRSKNDELTRFNRAMIGRELRMIELKKEVNELCGSASQPPRYSLDFEKE